MHPTEEVEVEKRIPTKVVKKSEKIEDKPSIACRIVCFIVLVYIIGLVIGIFTVGYDGPARASSWFFWWALSPFILAGVWMVFNPCTLLFLTALGIKIPKWLDPDN